jgi:hypothetical protein
MNVRRDNGVLIEELLFTIQIPFIALVPRAVKAKSHALNRCVCAAATDRQPIPSAGRFIVIDGL